MYPTLGPYRQMIKLGEHLASMVQSDRNLDLDLLVAHYLEEVKLNVRSDMFDHLGFIETIRRALEAKAMETRAPEAEAMAGRGDAFLRAVVAALDACATSLSSDRDLSPASGPGA